MESSDYAVGFEGYVPAALDSGAEALVTGAEGGLIVPQVEDSVAEERAVEAYDKNTTAEVGDF